MSGSIMRGGGSMMGGPGPVGGGGSMMGGPMAVGAPKGGGGGGKEGTGAASEFTSLISGSSAGGGGGGPEVVGGAKPGQKSAMGGGPTPKPTGVGGASETGATSTPTTAAKDKPDRYEFVVLFFWRENTPSDDLMTFKKPDPSTLKPAAGGDTVGKGSGQVPLARPTNPDGTSN